MDTLLNVNQAAYVLKVHPLTVRRYIKEGKLHAVRAGGAVRIKEHDLSEFTKDVIPGTEESTRKKRIFLPQVKPFSSDDPILRLESRGASLQGKVFR